MDQQATSPQQQRKDKKGVLIDLETFLGIKYSLEGHIVLIFLIFVMSSVGIGIVNNIVSQITFALIFIVSAIAMFTALDNYAKLDELTPKVKKIIKEIIYYNDGQTEEIEYEC